MSLTNKSPEDREKVNNYFEKRVKGMKKSKTTKIKS